MQCSLLFCDETSIEILCSSYLLTDKIVFQIIIYMNRKEFLKLTGVYCDVVRNSVSIQARECVQTKMLE